MENIIKVLPLLNKINFNIKGSTNPPLNPIGNTLWINTSTPIHYWSINEEEPYFKKSNNKNIFASSYASGGSLGTFTVKDDGSIVVSGNIASSSVSPGAFNVWGYSNNGILEPGTYTLSGCPSGGSLSTYCLCSNDTSIVDTGNGVTFTLTKPTKISFKIRLNPGTSVSNLIFKPQLEKGSSATSFIKGDATGHVWIATDKESPFSFNGLKKNAINICPYTIKQWENGDWVEKTGRFYTTPTDYLNITDYLKLDYLTTTGTQYIDTDITVFNQSAFSIEYTAAFTAVNYSYNHLWASTDGDENYQSWIYSDGRIGYKWGSDSAIRSSSVKADTSKHTYTFAKNSNAITMSVDGTQKLSSTNSGTLKKPLRLFTKKKSSYGKAKIYEIKIYVAGVLSYHLIPAKRISDGVIGLRDILNNKFYTNTGTGTFGAGSIKAFLE